MKRKNYIGLNVLGMGIMLSSVYFIPKILPPESFWGTVIGLTFLVIGGFPIYYAFKLERKEGLTQ